jgi:hypothetical protein
MDHLNPKNVQVSSSPSFARILPKKTFLIEELGATPKSQRPKEVDEVSARIS